MEPVNTTRAFLGDEPQSSTPRIELNDVQGLWGGRRITVQGSRKVILRIVGRGMFERRYEFAIDQDEWQHLLDIFVRNDFVTIQPADRPGLPDEAHPAITLTNSAGENRTIAKWAGVKDDRFEAIYVALVQLEALTLGLDPVYSGPFTPGT